MSSLAHQRCFNHSHREAAARCLECRQFFCRECITEHDDRGICAGCLAKLVRPAAVHRRRFGGVFRLAQCLLGVLMLWFFFYLAGEALLAIPTTFHEGTLWRVKWFDPE